MRTRLTIQTLDLHAGGEPLRLITAGYPPAPHAPILERRRWAREQADHVRRVVCFEPRGHRDMYGAVLLPPYRPDADIAVLFMHNEGYSTMCGHGILALTAGLIEEGLFPATAPETVIRFEAPAGPDRGARGGGAGRGGVAQRCATSGSPTFPRTSPLAILPCDRTASHLPARAAERGALSVDVAFGGAYYGIVDAAELGLRVVPSATEALTRAGAAITDMLRRDHTPVSPGVP